MTRESMWTTAGKAMELAQIRDIMEWEIVLAQELKRPPSPSEIQAALHRADPVGTVVVP